jgi:hypothetical protein
MRTTSQLSKRIQDLEGRKIEQDTFKVIIYEPGTIPEAVEGYDFVFYLPDNQRGK